MHRLLGVLWAGVVSAAICYAEYLGLGAMLGTALLGYGDQSQAMGTLLVVLAACISCLVLCARRFPVIAGPRGASLSILVLGLLSIQALYPVSGSGQLLVLVAMMLGCTATLCMGTMRWVQWVFAHLPAWLIPAFVYASALSIVASASHKYLYNCLMVSEWQTWGIFLSGVLAGLAWQTLCQSVARLKQLPPQATALARSLSGTSLVVGAGTAWLLYEYSSLRYASAGMCSRLGVLDLNLQSFFQRMGLLLEQDLHFIPLPALLAAAVWGLFVGLIVLIESRTAVTTLADLLRQAQRHAQAEALHTPLMRWNAGCQALLTPATTIASSVSQSRSQVIWSLYQPSAMAVLLHALALLAIALFAGHWLARLPQIALVVLMTLVACSMLIQSTTQVWQQAYSIKHRGIAGGLGLWAVLLISVVTGQTLLGFVLPAVWAIGLHWWRQRHAQSSP